MGRNEFEFSDSDSKFDDSCPSEDPPDEQETPCNIEINFFSEQTGNFNKNFKNAENEEVEVLQAKYKNIPRRLAPLEDLCDFDDVAKKPTIEHVDSDIEECNIGTEDRPKMIKLAKSIPASMKNKYIDLFREFIDVFTWSYEDLKAYDTNIIQHKIPLKENQKPFKQKLRIINPKQLPAVEKEIKKMYDASIIVPVRFSDWVSNLVVVRKKIGEIRLCIDFRNLNRASLKDNYPLPKMEHIL